MKNSNFIFIVVLLVIASGALFALSTNLSKTDNVESENTQPQQAQNQQEEIPKVTTISVPEGSLGYEIVDGSTASYVAQKRFFDKADEEVTGTTTNVTGVGFFDPVANTLILNAEVGLDLLDTGNSVRDNDVRTYWNPSIATFNVMMDSVEGLAVGESFELEVPGFVTINQNQVGVTFTVEGELTEEGFTATGSALANISDFGLDAPNILNVYTVDDGIELRFDVVGVRNDGVEIETTEASIIDDNTQQAEEIGEDQMTDEENEETSNDSDVELPDETTE